MKPDSGQINGKKGGLKAVLARFCPVIEILCSVPLILMLAGQVAGQDYVLRGMAEFTGNSQSPCVGISNCGLGQTDDYVAMLFTAPAGGQLSELHLNCNRGANYTLNVGLYLAASATNPDDVGNIWLSSASANVGASRFWNFNLSTGVVKGSQYWIKIWLQSSANTSNFPLSIPPANTVVDFNRGISDTSYRVFVRDSDGTPAGWWQSNNHLVYALQYSDGSLYGNSYRTTYGASSAAGIHASGTGGTGDDVVKAMAYTNNSGANIIVTRLEFLMTKAGAPSTNLLYEIWEDTFTATAAMIDSGTFLIPADIPTAGSYDWFGRNIPGIMFQAGKTYAVILKPTDGAGTDTSNYYYARYYDTEVISAFDTVNRGAVTYLGNDAYMQQSTNGGTTWGITANNADMSMRYIQDTVPPTGAILQPVNNRWRKSISFIEGTAADNYFVRGNSLGIELFIREEGLTNRRWIGPGLNDWSAYNAGDEYSYANWRSTGPAAHSAGTISWFHAMPTLTHNMKYTIYARYQDSSRNYSVNWSTAVFYYDIYTVGPPEQPDSLTQVPANNSVLATAPSAISGTASDNSQGGVNNVKWALWRNSDNAYWTGAWTAGPVPADPGSWPDPSIVSPLGGTPVTWERNTMLPTAGDMTDSVTYYITSVAADRVVNADGSAAPNYEISRTTVTFWWDISAPVSRSTMPAAGVRYSSLTGLYGTAYDNVRIDSLSVRLRRNTDSKYWNAAADAFNIDYATNAWITLGTNLALRTTNWGFTDAFTWTGNPSTEYQVNVQAKDYLRFETDISTTIFTYDLQAPVPVVTDPAALGYITAPLGPQTTAQGTVDTDAALVEVRLQDLQRGTTYWNETTKSWQDTAVWNTAEIYAAGFWRLKVSSGAWVSGRKYELYVKGTDSSVPTANVGYSATQRFWYDLDRPTSTITGIADGAVLAGLTTISGTAWDTSHFNPVGTSLNKTELSVYNTQLGQYFTGSGWGVMTPLAVNLDAGALNGPAGRWEHNWTITPSTGWINNYTYELRSRAQDRALNQENKSLYNPDTPRIRFTIDLEAPVAVATSPVNAGIYGAGSWNIYGTASDNQGLDRVELCLRDTSGNKYWNGSFWQDNPGYAIWFSSQNLQNLTGNTTNFSYSGVNWVSADYQLSARSRDDVGRWQANITTITFTIDIQAPASAVTLPENNKAYNSLSNAIASIQGTSSDDKSGIPNGGVEVWVRALGPAGTLQWPTTYWNGTGWQNNATAMWLPVSLTGGAGDLNRAWTYPTPNFSLLSNGGSGHRFKVQVRARDVANNQQVPSAENYFEYDVQLPTSAILNPTNNSEISKWQYLDGRAQDPYPGAGLDITQLLIIDRGTLNDADYFWWTGSSWTATANNWVTAGWTSAIGTGTWSWGFTPPSILTSGNWYRVISRARDKALNHDVVRATSTFKYDPSSPQSKLLDLRDFVSGDDTSFTDRLDFVHGEAWAGVPITEVAINIFDEVNNRTWNNGIWDAGNTGSWNNICSGKEYFTCSGSAIPPEFRDGSQDFRGRIRSRAKTAAKTETAGAGRTIGMRRGEWPYSFVTGPAHGAYLSALAAINMKLSWGGNTNPTWARVRVENITDATVVQDWADAAIGAADTSSYPNYAIYPATYTVGFTWTNNKIYRIRTRAAYDTASRIENPAAAGDDGIIVIFDQTAPTSRITAPAHGVTYNSLAQLSGTMGDNLSGADKIDISLADLNQPTTYYWRWWTTSGTWITGEYFNAATMPSTYTWTYSNLPAWEDGKVYNIRTRATDKAANIENLPAIVKYTDAGTDNSKTFRYDITGPASAVSFPVNTGVYKTLAQISGNSTDLYTNINNVELSVRRDNDNWYWDPANGWSAGSAQWFTAVSTYTARSVNWYYDFSDIWHTTYTYTAAARAKDNTASGQNQGAASSAVVFYIDKTNPDSVITFPTAQPWNAVASITGTASDNRKMYTADPFQAAKIRIYRAVGDVYWNAVTAQWETTANPELYWSTAAFNYSPNQSSGTFTLNTAAFPWSSGYTYRLESRSRDSVDNFQSVYSTVTFKFDNTNPESTVISPVEGTHYTALSTGNINGSFIDPAAGSGVSEVRIYVQNLTRGTTWWNGIDWTDIDADKWLFAVIGGSNWSWNSIYDTPLTWTDGHRYRIVSRARDLATNQEGNGAGNAGTIRDAEFVYDISRPTGTITYPINDGYISQSGRIAGTAFDAPNGIVSDVYVRVRQASGPKAGHYWRVSDSSWTLQDAPQVWNSIPPQGTLSPGATWWQLGTTPWQSGETYDINMNLRDRAGNFILNFSTVTNIKADFTAPTSTVTYPAHGSNLQEELTVISGSASDAAPGALDKVLVSYFCASGICNGNYWNRTAGAWNSASEIFYEATLLSGNRWEATGASSPTWVTSTDGITYRIFAKGVDQAANEVAKPPTPAAGPHIEFILRTPSPVSGITNPDDTVPHWRPSPAPTISGTAVYASTVQVRVVDYGPDLTEGTGNDDLAWNGAGWVSTAAFTGYVGVNIYSTPNWQWSIPSGSWNGNRKYRVRSKAIGATEESPGLGREFVIDSAAPVAAISVPSALYVKALPELQGTAYDQAPGAVQSVYFRVKRSENTQYWNWKTSTFTALSGADTDLLPILDAGLYKYTTGFFSTGAAFETDKSYVAQFFAVDKAGNLGFAAEKNFTMDRSSPTARLLIPVDADNSGMRSLPAISGTAADNHRNNAVQVAIQKWAGATLVWYDGAGFTLTQTNPNWITVSGANGFLSPDATSWIYAPAGLDASFESGYRHLLLSRAADVAGNIQDAFTVGVSSMVIKIDKNPPTSSIVNPLDNADGVSGRYKPSEVGQFPYNQLRGTAVDNPAALPAGVSAAQIRLSYLLSGDTWYWTGTAFSSGTAAETIAWRGAAMSGTGPVWNWDYTTSIAWPAVDREYLVEARSMDNSRLSDDTGDGSWEPAPYPARRFIVDNTPPSVAITTPTELGLDLATDIRGTANADLAGHNRTEVRISTGTGADTRYWTGSAWTTAPETWIYSTKLGPASWYYTVSPALLVEKTTYTVNARALDYAGNYSVVYSTRDFLNQRPVTRILVPMAAAYNSLPDISGTAADNTRVAAVRFTIYNVSQGRYYDPSQGPPWVTGVEGSAPWVPPQTTIYQSSAAWTYNIQNSSWTSGASYRV
ncbi:MAG: hypothetical protein FD189_320, partial [Elusimicrobia bacterium]